MLSKDRDTFLEWWTFEEWAVGLTSSFKELVQIWWLRLVRTSSFEEWDMESPHLQNGEWDGLPSLKSRCEWGWCGL